MTELATLTRAEEDYLVQCEETISHGLQTFIEVGTALAMIRDNRLYRGEHGTFDAYCADRWGFTDRRARQLIDAAAIGTMVPVESERQARELARVPEPERAEVWRQTVEQTDGKPTAAAIRDTYERTQTPATSPEPEPDGVDVAGSGHNHPSATGEADARLDATVGAAASEAPTEIPSSDGAGDNFREVLDHLVPDSNPHREWQSNFLRAVGGVNRLMLFTPADVAERADNECMAELIQVVDRLATWRAEAVQARILATPDNVRPIRRIS